MLICGSATAQWTNEHSISDFSKLLTSHINPYSVPDGAAVEARNLRANKTYGALVNRTAMLNYDSFGSYKITGLHRYYQLDDDKYLIVAGSTFLKSDKNDAKSPIIIRDELTDGRRWQFVTYNDIAIGVNGVDNPQKYDGHTLTTDDTDGARTASILTTDLGAPFAELNTGANLDASSWYQYKVAFYNGSVYYYSNAKSNPILTGATVRDLTLTNIPLGPAGTTHRYIYRTDGNVSRVAVEADTTFKLVGTIADNATTTFDDTTADGSVDTPLWATVAAGSNLTPPVAKFAMIHKESLWLAHTPVYPSDVYWSYPFKPDIFNSADYEPIRQNDGDEITFIKNQLGIVIVGKTNSIMKFVTISADSDQWQVLGPYSHIGCQAPYSAVNSPKGIFYLAKNGLYVFDGETSQLASDIVTRELRDVLWTSRDDVASVFYDNEYQMAYTSVESGSGINDRVLVLDIQRDAYVIDDKNINVFEVFDSGTDEGTLYSGSSDSDGNVLSHASEIGKLIYKTKSALEAGTAQYIDVFGSEQIPWMEISWGIAFDDASLVGATFQSATYQNATFQRPDTFGFWYSPIVEINASDMDKLYWNEDLGAYGDITFSMRFGATSGAVDSASFGPNYTNAVGADISGETANNFVQLRASFETSDILYSPEIITLDNFAIKMVYSKEGDSAEESIPTVYKTGMMDFGTPGPEKMIWEIEIFYTGDTGDIDFNLTNLEGTVDRDFTIDLSIEPGDVSDDGYIGNTVSKSYVHQFPHDGDVPIGTFFQYTISDDEGDIWEIYKIKTRYTIEEIQ